jgi:hypothetical protein
MRVIRFLALLVFTCAAACGLSGPARAEPVAASALAAQTSVSGERGLVQDVYWRRHYWHRHYWHHHYWRPVYHRYYYHPYYHHYGYYHRYGWGHRHYWHRHYWHRHWRRW